MTRKIRLRFSSSFLIVRSIGLFPVFVFLFREEENTTSRVGSNKEFNITPETVDDDDVVKPKNCFELATNS